MMKKILALLIGIMFIILPFSTAAEDTNVSEKDIKHILYSEAFSDMEYEEFEKLYIKYSEAYGEQTVPHEILVKYNLDDGVSTIENLSDIKTGYFDYFSSSNWMTRSDGVTLSIYWKDYLFEGTGNVVMYKAGKAWTALKNVHGNDSNWKNTDSMEAQFHCHVSNVGKLKKPYNIEPWRTETNMAVLIKCGCNA